MTDEPIPAQPVPDPQDEPITAVPVPAPNPNTATGPPNIQSRPMPAAARKAAEKASKTQPQQDGFRELVETIVFVVVLVLILKTFLAEAFVIPTGSMADTLLGYHKDVVCEQCGYRYLVNCSSEADPGERHRQQVTGCYCENCEYFNDLRPLLPQGGRN